MRNIRIRRREPLTAQERKLAELHVAGHTLPAAASILGTKLGTVKKWLDNVHTKYGTLQPQIVELKLCGSIPEFDD